MGVRSQPIKIVFVGDSGVGKTSIITSLITESFQERGVAPTLLETALPDESNPERVPTRLIDTSAAESERNTLELEVGVASVVVVVFDGHKPLVESRDSVGRWLQRLTALGCTKPVIVAGNKDDDGKLNQQLDEELGSLMEQYVQIDLLASCSAKSLRGLHELVQHAQRAVLYPVKPLLAASDDELLSPAFVDALCEIFAQCDHDGDGALNMTELNWMNRECFKYDLDQAAFDKLCALLRSDGPSDALDSNGHIKQSGFIYLQQVMLNQSNFDKVWTILRHFGFDDSLSRNQPNSFASVPSSSSSLLSSRSSSLVSPPSPTLKTSTTLTGSRSSSPNVTDSVQPVRWKFSLLSPGVLLGASLIIGSAAIALYLLKPRQLRSLLPIRAGI